MKRIVLISLLALLAVRMDGWAQYRVGTTGLLHAPTADMQRDKTFLFGGSQISKWGTTKYSQFNDVHRTYNYYINITFFPWLEVGYTCTLNHADEGSTYFPEQSWGKYTNQDRSFNFRIRLWKEGWWKAWTPQIVLGLDDPLTHSGWGGGAISTGGDDAGTENKMTRYYLAATKHFRFAGVGDLGAHLSFVIGNAKGDPEYKRPAAGVNFRFELASEKFWAKVLNGLNLMAEYYPIQYLGENGEETGGIDVGATYSIWKDHINLWCEQFDLDHFSWGVAFKVHL